MRGTTLSALALGSVALAAGAAAALAFRAGPRELRIVVTGELRARVRRCGCQGAKGASYERPEKLGPCCGYHQMPGTVFLPDLGGLPERSAWLARSRPVDGEELALDVGDLLFPGPSPLPYERGEWRRRAELLVEAYGILGVRAWVPGELDLALGRKALLDVVAASPVKTLAANLLDATTHEPIFPGSASFAVRGARVGVVAFFAPPSSPELSALLDGEGLELADPTERVRALVSKLRGEGADLVVLIAHSPEFRVRELVRAVPGIDLAYGAHAEVESKAVSPIEGEAAVARALPGGKAPLVTSVRLVEGARGVTVPEAYTNERDWLRRLEEQERKQLDTRARASTDEERRGTDEQLAWTRSQLEATRKKLPSGVRHQVSFAFHVLDAKKLKEGQDQTLLRAIDRYKSEVDALGLDPKLLADMEAPGKRKNGVASGFLGAATCASCHEKQAKVWQDSKHARAWASLELAGNQKDPECVRCHSVGFREPGGFAEARRAVRPDGTGTLDLRNVQCEACHGPRLGHPREDVLARMPTLETCKTCHDSERDPTFDLRRLDLARSKVCAKN